MKCPQCQVLLGDGASICPKCGTQCPSGHTCAHCGATLDIEDKLCKGCRKPTQELLTCPCGATLKPNKKFCSKCGNKVEVPKEKRVCRECGSNADDEDEFCSECGLPLSATDSLPAPTPCTGDKQTPSTYGKSTEPDITTCHRESTEPDTITGHGDSVENETARGEKSPDSDLKTDKKHTESDETFNQDAVRKQDTPDDKVAAQDKGDPSLEQPPSALNNEDGTLAEDGIALDSVSKVKDKDAAPDEGDPSLEQPPSALNKEDGTRAEDGIALDSVSKVKDGENTKEECSTSDTSENDKPNNNLCDQETSTRGQGQGSPAEIPDQEQGNDGNLDDSNEQQNNDTPHAVETGLQRGESDPTRQTYDSPTKKLGLHHGKPDPIRQTYDSPTKILGLHHGKPDPTRQTNDSPTKKLGFHHGKPDPTRQTNDSPTKKLGSHHGKSDPTRQTNDSPTKKLGLHHGKPDPTRQTNDSPTNKLGLHRGEPDPTSQADDSPTNEQGVATDNQKYASAESKETHVHRHITPEKTETSAETSEPKKTWWADTKEKAWKLVAYWNPLRQMPEVESNPSDVIRILLVGRTGSGKSSTGNTILGGLRFIEGGSFSSETAECQLEKGRCMGRRVEIMDSPGLFDTSKTHAEIADKIAMSVMGMNPGPHAVLYVVQMGQRYTEEEFWTYMRLKTYLGEEVTGHMIILFTNADRSCKKDLANAPAKFKRVMKECGNRCVLFENKTNENNKKAQVTTLLSQIEKMLRERGGTCYQCGLSRLVEGQMKKELASRIKEAGEQEARSNEYMKTLRERARQDEEKNKQEAQRLQDEEQKLQEKDEQITKENIRIAEDEERIKAEAKAEEERLAQKRKTMEEEQEKLAEQEKRMKKETKEEKKRIADEEKKFAEKKNKLAEEEKQRKASQERENKRIADEKKKLADDQKRLLEEGSRTKEENKAEAERITKKKMKFQEEQKKIEERELQRKAEATAEAQRISDEQKRLAEQEQKRRAEAKAEEEKIAKERKKIAEDQQRLLEEEKKKKEEAEAGAKRIAEERGRIAELQQKLIEERKQITIEEQKRKAEAEAHAQKMKEEKEALAKRMKEERVKAEALEWQLKQEAIQRQNERSERFRTQVSNAVQGYFSVELKNDIFVCRNCQVEIGKAAHAISIQIRDAYSSWEVKDVSEHYKILVQTVGYKDAQLSNQFSAQRFQVIILSAASIKGDKTIHPPSSNWFEGCNWRHAHCPKCNQHKGWINESVEARAAYKGRFYELCLSYKS